MAIRLRLPKVRKTVEFVVREEEVSRYLRQGFSIKPNRRFGKEVLVKDLKPWEMFEEELRQFFKQSLELDHVDGGYGFKLGGYQVDAVGATSNVILVLECKHKKEPGKKTIRGFLNEIASKKAAITRDARSRYGSTYRHTVFILALRGLDPSKSDISYAERLGIYVWSESYIDSIRSLYLTIGSRIKYYILKELGLEPPSIPKSAKRAFTFPALATNDVVDQLYSLFIPAASLLDMAYVLRVESGQKLAYQRLLDKNKLANIAKFIEDGKSFKNSIIISLPEEARFTKMGSTGKNQASTVGRLKFPRKYASCWVIDGQHRLYGFARVGESLREKCLPVIALRSASKTEEAQTFVDINHNQKQVDPSVLWSLFRRLDPDSIKGRISSLVASLAAQRSVFSGHIYVPGDSKKSRKHYGIVHANVCATIASQLMSEKKGGVRLLLSESKPKAQQDAAVKYTRSVLNNYFKWLERTANRANASAWVLDFFLKNNGVNVMIRVLVQILHHYKGKFSASKLTADFGNNLGNYLAEHASEISEIRKATSSEGTREAQAFSIVRALAVDHPNFAREYIAHRAEAASEPTRIIVELENLLRNLVTDRLSALTARWWKQRLPESVWRGAEDRLSRQELTPWMRAGRLNRVEFLNFSDYRQIILRNDNWTEAFSAVFKDKEFVDLTLRVLEKIRNAVAHSRDLTAQAQKALQLASELLAASVAGGNVSEREKKEIKVVAAAA